MAVPVYLLGDDSPFPFVGAFYVSVEGSGCWLRASGRIAVSAGVEASYLPARRIEAAIQAAVRVALQRQSISRYDLIREVWNCLQSLAVEQLGPEHGRDLSLAISAGDSSGVDVTATGVSGLWGKLRIGKMSKWIPLVEEGHPLLSLRGIPEEMPGSLALGKPPGSILAMPGELAPVLPEHQKLTDRVGIREL